MREDDIIIRLIINTLIINSYGLMISIKIIPILSEIKELMVAPVELKLRDCAKQWNIRYPCGRPLGHVF